MPLPEVDSLRRTLAVLIDLGVAGLGGAALAFQSAGEMGTGTYWAALIGCLLGVSFANQVLLTWATRVSIGKFVLRLRVVRDPGGDWIPPHGFARAGFWRLVQRWLLGLCYLPIETVLLLLEADGDPEDACQVRLIRRRDLLAAG